VNARDIDGKAIAQKLRAGIGRAVAHLRESAGVQPGLAVVIVGDDPASHVYVRNKALQTVETGMASFEHRLPADIQQDVLLELIAKLNADPAVDGILVQLPLPPQINAARVIAAIDPAKDVDGFHPMNMGRLASGLPGLVPCTPYGCLLLLRETGIDLSGRNAVVVGRSNIVGKPMALLLLAENCTVTIAHSRTRDLPAICRNADILVAAVGRPAFVAGDWIKPGAIVIDVGINRISEGTGERTRLVGDVDYDAARKVAAAITPVPGGVGPMTIACLLRNTLVAAAARRGLSIEWEG
jgi:methylenetetrahydrofolate dehydrogenase (NADP+) / methenyltetrahydrofolate cyclohydrolase